MRKSISLLILLLALSCGNEKRLHFVTESAGTLDSCIFVNDFTILCYIDSADCTVCSMQWLTLWSHRERELEKLNTGIVLIVNNTDEKAVYDALEHLQLKFPVAFDNNSALKQNNPLLLGQFPVFAVNREKEVVWLGTPIESETTWNLFCKTLQKLSESK